MMSFYLSWGGGYYYRDGHQILIFPNILLSHLPISLLKSLTIHFNSTISYLYFLPLAYINCLCYCFCLQLFVAHFHIFLSVDALGVLVLIPNHAVLNALLTTVILVCVSHEINHITTSLSTYLIPRDNVKLMRNCAIVLVVIMPFSVIVRHMHVGN